MRSDLSARHKLIRNSEKQIEQLEIHLNRLSNDMRTIDRMIGSIRKRQMEIKTKRNAKEFNQGFVQ